ncbi:uncharacterized protein LOC100203191 isoform X2 [Hydra vulgaris]|uniref:Uncharacterized protein LOC100203191 isoform X2 n=1 Tax=Hydra vulgaris TaxID=6087 RepID=A0ABM4C0J8_HYDVU
MSAKPVKYKPNVQFTESKVRTRRQTVLLKSLAKDQLEPLSTKQKILKPFLNNSNITQKNQRSGIVGRISNKLKNEKEEKETCVNNANILNEFIDKKNIDNLKVEDLKVQSLKRKRGRPKMHDDNVSIIKLNPKKNKKNNIVFSQKHKRTQRMASLNAMAKVNAVFDRAESVTNKSEGTIIEIIDKKNLSEELTSDQIPNFQIDILDSKKESNHNNVSEQITSDIIDVNNEYHGDNSPSAEKTEKTPIFPIWKKCGTFDKAIQTDCHHKYVQTEFPKLNKDEKCMQASCLCRTEQPKVFNNYSPSYKADSQFPLYMKSTVLAHNEHHSIVLPITKKHIFYDVGKSVEKNDYSNHNVSSLVNECRKNSFLKHSELCSKLIYLKENNYLKNDKPDNTVGEKKMEPALKSLIDKNHVCPKNKVNDIAQNISKMKKKPKPNRSVKACNGWRFDGDCIEEIVKVHGEDITRKFYTGLYRKDETISVHDAVLLQSGARRYNLDYIARISAIWEDTSGSYKDDMMISVFWYYKPEQITGKCAEISVGEMEVFASRHQDDNSVACIVDKCYVITFPQFNRYRAQHKLWKAKCKEKLSVVPENKKISRLIPSPDIDPSIVFFCRYAYDYRLGRILKN